MADYDLASPRTAACSRCGRILQIGASGNPNARLLKRTDKPNGYCANCSATQFLRTTGVLAEMMRMRGPEVLLNPMIQAQFLRVMQSGNADAQPLEIDWGAVVKNWHMPVDGEKKVLRQMGLEF